MRPLIALLLATLACLACDQPPTKELGAAAAALDQARAAGADRYASDRYHEAEVALQDARRKAGEKDYRGALSSAMEAAEKARAAAQAAGVAKTLARGAAETAKAEGEALLEQAEKIRAEARAARLPDEAFAQVVPQAEAVRAGLTAIEALLAQGDFLGAQKTAADLKSQAAAIAELFEQARKKWEDEHPKRGPRRRR